MKILSINENIRDIEGSSKTFKLQMKKISGREKGTDINRTVIIKKKKRKKKNSLYASRGGYTMATGDSPSLYQSMVPC